MRNFLRYFLVVSILIRLKVRGQNENECVSRKVYKKRQKILFSFHFRQILDEHQIHVVEMLRKRSIFMGDRTSSNGKVM